MALTDNKIGPYPFISLTGEPVPPMELTIIDDRPGVAGSETVLLGNKGEPFSMFSRVDAENYFAGKGYHTAYKTIIGTAVELVQGGASSEAEGYRVLVLRVIPGRVYPIRNAVGNTIHPPSLAMVETRWDLLAVPLE